MNQTEHAARSFPWTFVVLTYGLSWSIWVAGWLLSGKPIESGASGTMMAAIFLGSFAPGMVAAMLLAQSGGASKVKAWLRDFIRVRCGWRAYAAALLPFPIALLILTALFVYVPMPDAAGGDAPALFYLTIFPVSILNGVATVFMGAGPLGEEGGWRGYLLPRLIEVHGEWRSSLIIGVIWSLWHLPVMAMFPDWRDGIDFWTYLPLYTLSVTALSYLMTRVWVIGRGSLVPVIWLHGLVNAVGPMAFNRELWSSVWSQGFGVLLFALAALASALVLNRNATKRKSE